LPIPRRGLLLTRNGSSVGVRLLRLLLLLLLLLLRMLVELLWQLLLLGSREIWRR
jgi:hypothetical protein